MNRSGYSPRRGVTLPEVVIVIVVLVILLGLLLPATQRTHFSDVRTRSMNNLHQIGIAMNNYAGSNLNQLPRVDVHNAPLFFSGQKGGTPTKAGTPSTAPVFQDGLLSFMEGNTHALQAPLDLNLGRAGKVNGEPAPCSYSIPAYWSTVTVSGFLTISDSFQRGTSQCIGAAEMTSFGVSYAAIVPFSLNPYTPAVANKASTTANSFYTNGDCLVVMMDASVRTMRPTDNARETGFFVLAQQPDNLAEVSTPRW